MKILKTIGIILLVMVISPIIFFTYLYVQDYLTVTSIKRTVKWVENFYSENGYYPTNSEFTNQFPKLSGYITYGKPYSYHLHYNLSSMGSSLAVGEGAMGYFGPSGEYTVEPCKRWVIPGTENKPTSMVYTFIKGTPFEGLILADFDNQQVYFEYGGNGVPEYLKDKKIMLLNGVVKPRLFSTNAADKIYITNGNDILSYKIVVENNSITLSQLEKIGTVPTSCPN